jgi:Fur family transcriptional regulator, stress-responsive regulator
MAVEHELEQVLRGASLRVTRPRLAVLAAVREHPHADTPSLVAQVRGELGEVSTQAVYDVLGALHGAGLIRRIQPEGSVARYETRTGDNHHHVVCRDCGTIADVDCAVGHAPCLTADENHGFVIDEAEVIYWGLCPRCITSPSSDSGSASHDAAPATTLGSAPSAAPATEQSISEPTRGSHDQS